jgi:hypothetical protein
MNPTLARRLGKAVALLGSPEEGEVLAAARAIGRTLESAAMDWHGFAQLVTTEATRQASPAFTFASIGPRGARKLMAHLARQPGATDADKLLLERLRARLLGETKLALTDDEVRRLDALWHKLNGAAT